MRRSEFIDPKEMSRLRGQLRDLLEIEEGLSSKEMDFLEGLNEWEGEFTVAQADWLDRIYERVG